MVLKDLRIKVPKNVKLKKNSSKKQNNLLIITITWFDYS